MASEDSQPEDPHQDPHALTMQIGDEEVVVRQRYEVLSIANDAMLGVWFTVGSVLFFFESTMIAGTWCFLLGSIQLLIRPVIRMARRVHIQRAGSAAGQGDVADEY